MAVGEWTALKCPSCGQSNMAHVDPARRSPCGKCGASLGEALPLHQDLQGSDPPDAVAVSDGDGPPGPPPVAAGPPAYPPPPALIPQAPSRPYRPLAGVARTLVIMIAIGIALDVIAVVSDIAYIGLLERIRDGASVSSGEAEAGDIRVGFIGLAQVLLYLATAIVFIVWFHRAYSNLYSLGATPRHKPGWAIGGWFVPILSFIRPKQMANDIWRASDPDLRRDLGREYEGERVPPLIDLWWAGFIIANVLVQIGSALAASAAGEGDELVTGARWVTYGDIASVVVGVLALLTVRALTARQDARALKYLFARPPD